MQVSSALIQIAVGVLLVTNKIFYLNILVQQFFTLLGVDVTRFL